MIDLLRFDLLSVTNLITAFVGGAMFTVAIILTGTLTDYKESERVPSDLVTSISALYEDSQLIRGSNADIAGDIRARVRELLLTINRNFRANAWQVQRSRRSSWPSTRIFTSWLTGMLRPSSS